jgi:hypothetical protein
MAFSFINLRGITIKMVIAVKGLFASNPVS